MDYSLDTHPIYFKDGGRCSKEKIDNASTSAKVITIRVYLGYLARDKRKQKHSIDGSDPNINL